jgi:hypothetical protein
LPDSVTWGAVICGILAAPLLNAADAWTAVGEAIARAGWDLERHPNSLSPIPWARHATSREILLGVFLLMGFVDSAYPSNRISAAVLPVA